MRKIYRKNTHHHQNHPIPQTSQTDKQKPTKKPIQTKHNQNPPQKVSQSCTARVQATHGWSLRKWAHAVHALLIHPKNLAASEIRVTQ